MLDIRDPAAPAALEPIGVSAYGAVANSAASRGGVVAVENAEKTEPGTVAFLSSVGELLSWVEVGALPDMLTFTSDGSKVLVANEGEPSDDYTADPEGSVSIIDVSGGAANVTQEQVTTVNFTAFNDAGLEPEFIAVSPDSPTAWVSLQENNAPAILALEAGTVSELVALGFKDHSVDGSGLDPSDEDGGVQIAPWPVRGMY